MEFAVTVPIVFLFLFAAIEFGRMQMIRQSLENASYEGARRGVVPATSDAEIRQAAQNVLDVISVVNPQIVVVQTDETVRVTVSVNANENSWISPFYFRNRTLSSTITLSKDRS